MSNNPVCWENLAWPDIADALARSAGLVLWPVGATEQHGPHLGTGTDTLIADRLARAASARTGVPVLPALPLGCSMAHSRRWPGTLSLTPETMSAVVRETGEWLHASGVRRLLIVNGHVGNFAPLRCALEHLRAGCPGLMVGIVLAGTVSTRVREIFSADADDWHANAAETSLVLHLRPEAACADRISAADDPDRTGGCVFAHPVHHTSRNGVTGRPSEASAGEGARLFDLMVDDLAALVERARGESPPLDPASSSL
jgi:creatinine amidohydrolase